MRTPRFALVTTAVATALATYALVVPTPAAAAVVCQGQRATLVGTAGDDVLRGGAGRDVIAGLAGKDRVFGLGGDDVLCGGDGADLLVGGDGHDRLDGGVGGWGKVEGSDVRIGDELVGGPGDDRLDVGANGGDPRRSPGIFGYDVINLSGATGGARVDLRRGVARGEGRDVLVRRPMALFLSRGDDVVRSAGLPVMVVSGAGDDRLTTGGAKDELFPDGDFNPSFLSSIGDVGSGGDDLVRSAGGNDRVDAEGGRDMLRTGPGDDDVVSGQGRDTIETGPGDDKVMDLGRDADAIDAGRGRDVVDDDLVGRRGESLTLGPDEGLREDLFVNARRRVHWDMAAGLATIAGVGVPLSPAPESYVGGRSWVIVGTDAGEYVGATTARRTTFFGQGGDDRFSGNYRVPDVFDGGEGVDRFVGLEKRNNVCVSVERDPERNCAAG